MRLHLFSSALHFLLYASGLQAHVSRPIRSAPAGEDLVKRVDGDDYGSVSMGTSFYRKCNHAGFFNPERWEESGAAEAYMKWSILVNKTSDAWMQRQSEPNFFLRDVLDWSDFDCGITYKGCVGMPTCDQILIRTRNETTARMIYFILLSMHNYNLVSGTVNEQSIPAQANVASMASNMANTFFWKHSDELERECKQKSAAMKGVVNALLNIAVTAIPGVARQVENNLAVIKTEAAVQASQQLVGETAIIAENAANEASAVQESVAANQEAEVIAESNLESFEAEHNLAGTNAPSTEQEGNVAAEQSVLENQVAEAHTSKTAALEKQKKLEQAAQDARAEYIINKIKHEQALIKKKAKDGDLLPTKPIEGSFYRKVWDGTNYVLASMLKGVYLAPNTLYNFPLTAAGTEIDSKFCADSPNPTKEKQHAHEMLLDTEIEQAAVNFRAAVQMDAGFVNGGAGFGENGTFPPLGNTVLSDVLFGGEYVQFGQKDQLRFVDEPSRIEADITNHFKNAMISAILKEELCFMHCTREDLAPVPDSPMASSQVVPVPGTVCQTQCWRNWKTGLNVELYGIHDLLTADNDWNLELEDFVSESFKHWQDHRFDQKDEGLFPTVEELFRGATATSSSGSFLPVCYSELVPPVNMSNKETQYDPPCFCGNEHGNETQVFYKEAGFDRWVGNQDGKVLAAKCFETMGEKKLPPVTTYLQLCDQGWHFPLVHEDSTDLLQGADDQCDTVRVLQASLTEQGHDDHNVNCRICFDTPVGAMIKTLEHDGIAQKSRTGLERFSFQHDGIAQKSHTGLERFSFWEECDKYDQDPRTSCLY